MKSLSAFLVILFIAGSLNIMAQKNKNQYELKIKKKDFRTEQKEGLKEAWRSVLLGNDYYAAGVGTYALARDHYLFAHQYNPDNTILNYLIGVCYLYTDDKYEALKYLRKAYDKRPDLTPEIEYYLARGYHLVLEFNKAIGHYQNYRDKIVALGDVNAVFKTDRHIEECQNGKELVENPKRVIISNMGDSINSIADDYFSVFSHNDSMVYFTSRRLIGKKEKRNPYDNKFFEDIYVSKLIDNGLWSGSVPLYGKVNSSANDALIGVSPDGSQIFVYRGKKKNGDIYVSNYNPKKSNWKSPKPISKRINSDQQEGSVFLTITGDTLYFTSANEEETIGGRDILFSVKDENGKWSDPIQFGSLVNTKYNEEGIFFTPAGNEMYFSSQGHNSMGGYDVFYTYLLDDGTWSDPENLGYPINTADDDLFYVLSSNGKYGYYSTNREGGKGGRDIYKVTFLGSEKELLLENKDIMISGIPDTIKQGFYELPELLTIDSFYYLTGRVLDKETNEPLFGKLEFIDIDISDVVATAISSDSGKYIVKFVEAKKYGVEVIVKDYLFYLDVIDMTGASTDEPKVLDILLEKIKVGTKVVLENIYFETGKATLKADSYVQLNQVITFLESNETIRLEISGHTDNTGSLKINTKLSEDRAKAVVDYLVSQGIDKTRLESKGYAFTQPIAPNDTAEGREQNRRVEFKVLSK